jgi:hypothetical protein
VLARTFGCSTLLNAKVTSDIRAMNHYDRDVLYMPLWKPFYSPFIGYSVTENILQETGRSVNILAVLKWAYTGPAAL